MTRLVLLAASLGVIATAAPALAEPKGPAPDKSASIAKTNEQALRQPEDASLIGALHEFAYERGALYAIEASPQRITDIALEPGEALLSVSAGDTTRWIVGDAHSGAGAGAQAHVLVKPNAPGLSTNVIIMTDRRVYHLELKSLSGAAMAAVSWRYPAEMVVQSQLPPPALTPTKAAPPPAFALERFNLDYKISGDKPDWRPIGVFDDGHHVFIEMPPAIATLEAPPFFILGDEGPELVNYRVQGRYYIVDRLFSKAQLTLGTGWNKKIVRIERLSPIGDSHE